MVQPRMRSERMRRCRHEQTAIECSPRPQSEARLGSNGTRDHEAGIGLLSLQPTQARCGSIGVVGCIGGEQRAHAQADRGRRGSNETRPLRVCSSRHAVTELRPQRRLSGIVEVSMENALMLAGLIRADRGWSCRSACTILSKEARQRRRRDSSSLLTRSPLVSCACRNLRLLCCSCRAVLLPLIASSTFARSKLICELTPLWLTC